MKWEILILTQPSREPFLAQLMPHLERQRTGLDVGITVQIFDPTVDLGTNRTRMMRASTAEYINFVDDDDWVSPGYLRTVFPLLDGVDQIGYEVKPLIREAYGWRCSGREFHSLKSGRVWKKEGTHYFRNISHINPIRRELAIQTRMEGGPMEDHRWSIGMTKLGIVKTEHYIDHPIMYYYLWRPQKNDAKDATDPKRLEIIQPLTAPANV